MERKRLFWRPDDRLLGRIDQLIGQHRRTAVETLEPLVRSYYPALIHAPRNEYRKMMELSAKMTVVGHSCSEVAGYPFDPRRQRIASLFGGCCFLADSFIDDFGREATREYLERFELLLTKGWFEIKNDREKLFYVIVSRLFSQRDVLDPVLRQAILRLYEAQRDDVELRSADGKARHLTRRHRLQLLRECARNRSGHAILVLSGFLLPELPLRYLSLIYVAGELIMHIDDHGDCYSDLYYDRATYMNQVKDPVGTLRRVFNASVARLQAGLPEGSGRDLLMGFLFRYYRTRMEKHQLQRNSREAAWTVYE